MDMLFGAGLGNLVSTLCHTVESMLPAVVDIILCR